MKKYVCMCVYMRLCACGDVFAYLYVWMDVCACTYGRMCVCVLSACAPACMYVCEYLVEIMLKRFNPDEGVLK